MKIYIYSALLMTIFCSGCSSIGYKKPEPCACVHGEKMKDINSIG